MDDSNAMGLAKDIQEGKFGHRSTEIIETSELLSGPAASTLLDLLRWRALHQPDRQAYTFLVDGETQEVTLTYADLDRRARAIAALLQSLKMSGARVLLLYPLNLEYVAAFFGCLYAGVVAVPGYPPDTMLTSRTVPRLLAIMNDAQPSVALTTSSSIPRVKAQFAQEPTLPDIPCLATDNIASDLIEEWQAPALDGDMLAFLQYTSGSTATPRGIMISHRNVLQNEQMLQRACQFTEESTIACWVPMYHDLGLISHVLQALYLGARCVLLTPEAFVKKPFRWLQAISRYQAAFSGGPNFAYELCVRKITPEQRALLDLGSWSVALNGAEPVRPQTLERFAAAFESCGFRREAFYPAYGLAEATAFVSGGLRASPPVFCDVQEEALKLDRVVLAKAGSENSRAIVGCGRSWLDQEIAIANPATLTKCSREEIGEIWVSGPNIARGYWNRPEESEMLFKAYLKDTREGPFLRTGDLGFLRDGELFVTGRLKDLIIIRGGNYYPQDIELTAEQSHPALRPGCSAAFSVEVNGEEWLVVVQEIEKSRLDIDTEEVLQAISLAIAESHGLQVYAVVLIQPGSIPKTTSGKIQRKACRASFLSGSLDVVAEWRNAVAVQSGLLNGSAGGRPLERVLDAPQRFWTTANVEAWLVSHLSKRLGIDAGCIDILRPLTHYGLDSLAAIELVNEVETDLGVVLPMVDFLEAAHLAHLAALVFARLQKPSSHPPVMLAPAHSTVAEYPLSYGQQSLWFLHQLEPASAAYNIASAMRIRGDLNILALRRVFQTLVDRHPSLRTTFTTLEGTPVQRVLEHMEVCLHEQDASTWSTELLHEYLVGEVHRPFDLERSPLLRLYLLKRSPQEHILLLVVHHIVSDFWSVVVLLHEMNALYRAEEDGAPAQLAPLLLQYSDYTRWQREWLESPEGEAAWSYWRQQLSGELPVLDLPTDRPRPLIQSSLGSSHHFKLDAELTRKLKALSEAEQVTLYTTLLAAFQLLLYRYTGQRHFLVGSPTAGRSRADLSGLVGYFVNPVALRADIPEQATFHTFLLQVRQTVLGALKHQDYPFAQLVEHLQVVRDPCRSPLFQVMFILQKAHLLNGRDITPFVLREPGERIDLGHLPLESMPLEQRWAQFDLTLSMVEVKEGLLASLEYNTDLFDADTIEGMAEHLHILLEGIAANPEQEIGTLPILTPLERQQLLVEWNASRREYPQDTCIHHLFEAQVGRTPEATAVIYENEHLTYQELNRRATQLAHHLRMLGVGPEVLVGLYVERSLDLLIGLLGILKAGGAYVPLDPTYPKERLAFMLEDAQVPVLLTQQRLLAGLPACKAQVLCLDAPWQPPVPQTRPPSCSEEVRPAHLAYLIYTSGSTGKPKGAMNTHQAIVNRLHWMQQAYRLTPTDRVLQKTPLSFDVSVWECFWPLLSGACVVLARPGGHRESRYLLQLIAEQHITTLHFVPSMLQVFLEEQGLEACRELRQVFCSGEALPFELQERFFARLQASLHNLYGPTEAAIDVTSWACQPQSPSRVVPIGSPIANTQIYLLDSHLQLVPIGVAGEVHIGGIGLARGYWRRADLTAEKFIPDPFSRKPGARLYQTGDRARWREDGSLEYLGRRDQQVKLRGYRIELGEIEAVLSQHHAVREAVVLAREDVPGDKRLVAYVIAQGEQVPSASALRRFLQEKLPDYMVPSAFVLLDGLPLTSNGKLDRQALPPPEQTRAGLDIAFVGPRTPIEEMLAAMWAELLGVKEVGIHDNFFELGGHSLLATQVIARVRQVFQVELPLRCLFEKPTVTGLAVAIEQHKQTTYANPVTELPKIVHTADQQHLPFPLADVQQAYWIGRSESFELGNVAAHVYVEFESRELNLERLNRVWQRLIERHGMLRAIVLPDGQQQILEQVSPYQIEVLDLRGQDSGAVAAQLDEVRQHMSQQVLKADQWPLFEIRGSRLNDQRIRLHISFDALIADAWSLQILARELSQLYQNPDIPLAPLEISFRDYILAEIAFRHSELYQRSWEYWCNRLPTLSQAPALPLAKNPSSLTHPWFKRLSARLESEIWLRLKARASQVGLTPSGILLAAFAEILAVWGKSSRFTINLTLFNRLPLHPQVNDIVGDFTSLILLEVNSSLRDTFETRARQLQAQLWEDLDHRYVCGVRVLRELSRMQGGAPGAAMPVVFTSTLALDMQGQSESLLAMLGDVVYSITQTPQVWLDHQVGEEAGALVFNWDSVEDLFPGELLQDMFDAYCRLLLRLANEEGAWQETTLQLIPTAQLEQRAAFNTTVAVAPKDLLHTLFTAQVPRRLQEAAVVSSDRTLTYEELYRRSNEVGHQLRQLGAHPNTLVAVVMEKGWEQVVAVLGALNSGAAYLPIDPSLPKERLWYLLRHGEVALALTQSWLNEKLEWPEGVQRLCIDTLCLTSLADSPLEPVQELTDLAYLIYTSGSTGMPKGVMIEHRAAVNTILDINARFGVSSGDRVLALSSLSFDLSVYDIFGVLAAGGTIVLPEAEAVRDPAEWAHLLEHEQITLWNSVPALMELLMEYQQGQGRSLPASLRVVLLSGDWIPVTLPDRLRALCPTAQVISLGGATEASIWSIYYPIGQVDPAWTSIPYGYPLGNQSWQVLNEALEPSPVWVPGQLYIGGLGLARGYWREEERTAASFLHHPRTGERLYRTGDLGRYWPDGSIEFLGREDLQVKVQGYRIELGEIEATLAHHPQVREAAVAALGERQQDKRLVAYVVGQPGTSLSTQEVRHFLQEHLPGYMVPSTVLLLEALPLTSNGKVDRKALPALLAGQSDAGSSRPTSTVDAILMTQVAELVASVLKQEQIDPQVDLLEYGATSLDIIRLVNLLEGRFHVRPKVSELFQLSTVTAIAAYCQEHRDAEGSALLPRLASAPEQRYQPFPLTEIQQAYWVGRSSHIELGNVATHFYLEVERDELDLPRFTTAWQRLIERHDMLRMIVLPQGQQQILEQVPAYQIETLDLRTCGPEQAVAQLEQVRQHLSHQVLPPERWPLFEIRASLLPNRRVRLHMSFDMLIADAWGFQILFEELQQLYEQPDTLLPQLEISFRDYVLAEAQLRNSAVYQRAWEYWQQRLPTLPPAPDLPLAVTPGSLQQPRFVRRAACLEPVEWQRLKQRAAQAGLTASGVLLAAFAEVLGSWSKSQRFTLNLTLFNRLPLHPQVNDLVGDFTSLTLISVDHTVPASFLTRARRLQEQLWERLDQQAVNGIHLLRELARLHGGISQALMPVVFTSTLAQRNPEQQPGRWIRPDTVIYSISQTPQVWLDQQVFEEEGTLSFNWDVVEELFPEGLVDDMFSAYTQLLHWLATEHDHWQESLPCLIPQQHQEQRAAVNATQAPVADGLLHSGFLAQVAQRPEHVAVCTPTRQLTYRELGQRAAALASRLRVLGARPNRLVAIVMHKGWEQVVGALGVLLSGAAYLPLDPDLPAERLHALLAHGEVSLALTQSWLEGELAWPHGVQHLCVDLAPAVDSEAEFSQLAFIQQPEDLAYVIYTSGSTGMPKGVMIEHRAAVNTILDTNERFGVSSGDRVLALSALSFDLSVYDIFGVLAAGGTIVLPEAEAVRDPAEWAHLLEHEQITLWNSVPALMELLMEYQQGQGRSLPASLRVVLLSGDWIPVTLPDRLRALCPTAQVISLGGATEASIWSIYYPIGQVDPAWTSIPYGYPLGNQSWQVLNEALEPSPVWVPGQLYIGGLGLARGYWREEERTAASFLHHPRTGERLYRTGDLGRYWPDGSIEFLGREDLQVKVQGYRIELGEIEATLAHHPQVREAAVAALGERQQDKRLVAYVVGQPGTSLSTQEVRHFLQEHLPGYMVPSTVLLLEALPLTSNGKVDRKALPALLAGQSDAGSSRPTSTVDAILMTQVAELVASVLKVEHLDHDANLLDCGASSLDIIRLANLLESRFHIHLRFGELFQLSTVTAIAAYCQEHAPLDELFTGILGPMKKQEPGHSSATFNVLFDPQEREQFKAEQLGLRRKESNQSSIQLAVPELDDTLVRKYVERRSYRTFNKRPLPLEEFSEFLGCLRQILLDGKPKYQWGSAGDLYPVQTYWYFKPGSVEGIDSGIYYYHPVDHQLLLIKPNVQLDRSVYGLINRHTFEQSTFAIFLIGQLRAIGPMYGELSRDFCLIEAGLMAQLLETSAPAYHIGLCQIGNVAFEEIRHLFDLEGGSMYLHSLLGGARDADLQIDLSRVANSSDWEEGNV